MIDVAEVPTVTAAGEVAVIVKSTVKLNVAVVEWDSVPLVPVMPTGKLWDRVEEHDRVAVPEPVMLVGVMAPQVNPVGTVSVRLTVPVKPLTAVIVIVEVNDAPGLPEGLVAVMVKSVTENVAVVL
jgi:hypothetical protein